MKYQFADCVLDLDRRELTRAAQTVAVGPQVFDLLVHLVENHERVVSKDGLLDAVWNGRVVSDSTLTSHINAARRAIGDSGAEQRLVRTVARKGFRFVGDIRQVGLPEASREAAIMPEIATPPTAVTAHKPSIAVMPFQNLSGDPEQDYFADGVAEEIITALSRVRWLFVVARNSSFAYRGRPADMQQISRELGVTYVLEGSVRKAADRLRITGQLVNATTNGYLWADRFEGALDDIFTLQDRISGNVVGAIAPQMELAEIERARRKPTENLSAYDCYLRGLAHLHRGGREAAEEALPLFRKAVALDAEFAPPYAMAAWCYFWRKVNGWTIDPVQETAEGIALARRALELGRDDAVVLARAGHALAHLAGEFDSGIALLDRALFLNPNMAPAWFLGGFLRVWHGEPEGAIEYFEHAMRLSPVDPELYRMQAGIAMAHLFGGRFETASLWAEQAQRNLPSFLMAVATGAASQALSGRTEDARRTMDRLLELSPALRLSSLKDWLPIRRQEDFTLFAEGLHKAGLPDQ